MLYARASGQQEPCILISSGTAGYHSVPLLGERQEGRDHLLGRLVV